MGRPLALRATVALYIAGQEARSTEPRVSPEASPKGTAGLGPFGLRSLRRKYVPHVDQRRIAISVTK